MNRHQRRVAMHDQHKHVGQLPAKLTPVPDAEIPNITPRPIKMWISKHYAVQLYEESNVFYPDLVRLSVNRSQMKSDWHWKDNLTWDELYAIKCELGFGDWYGIEIYPPDKDVINVANMRHLWLIPSSLYIGWTKEKS